MHLKRYVEANDVRRGSKPFLVAPMLAAAVAHNVDAESNKSMTRGAKVEEEEEREGLMANHYDNVF